MPYGDDAYCPGRARMGGGELMRYWCSWWSSMEQDKGCTEPPFQHWISGYRASQGDASYDECSICAVIDAESEAQVWQAVARHFPDHEQRFCNPRTADWTPGDRFRGFRGQTAIND
jgi:hypothetical protein